MKLNLKKPVVFFDIESTGLSVSKDRIVELGLIKINPDQSEESLTLRINPEMEISEESEEIHGISLEDLKDAPKFKDVAPRILEFIGDADLAGYNSNKFDIYGEYYGSITKINKKTIHVKITTNYELNHGFIVSVNRKKTLEEQ